MYMERDTNYVKNNVNERNAPVADQRARQQRSYENYQNAKRNTVNAPRKKCSSVTANKVSQNFKDKLKKAAAIGCCALFVSLGAYHVGQEIHNDYQDNTIISEYLEENDYYDTIVESTWSRNIPREGNRRWGYNHSKLAEWVCNSEYPDVALYSIYRKVSAAGVNVQWNMDEVITRIPFHATTDEQKAALTYDGFQDYLEKKGFVDKEGNVSTKEYKETMNAYILSLATQSNIESELGIKGGK